MIYATSDIHGYPLDSFLDLLKKADFGPSDHLYVIGDVIDRNGDGGVAMLRWMMKQPNVTMIRGNHESMMLDCEFLFDLDLEHFSGKDLSPEQQHALLLWNQNGALVTITNLTQLKMTDPEEFSGLMKYVRSTPLYVQLKVPMKTIVLVHGGFNGFDPEKPLDAYSQNDLVWTRPDIEEDYWSDRLVILGHTPTQYYGKKGKAFVTPTWIDIDTGAAAGGSPMLLRLDDLAESYAES
jgi:serine/threonine protein phosphatase 1